MSSYSDRTSGRSLIIMALDGVIILHRSIQQKEIWDDPFILKCWLDILFLVDYDETGRHGRGCHKVTDSFFQMRWGCSRKKVRKILELFCDMKMIELKKEINRLLLRLGEMPIHEIDT